jgi:hypothetical protein
VERAADVVRQAELIADPPPEPELLVEIEPAP